MKVYIVVYSNHLVEEWEIKGVYSDKEVAHKEAEKLATKHKESFTYFTVEAHDIV